MNKIFYYSHILLMNKYFYLFIILFYLSLTNLDAAYIECSELSESDLAQKAFINNVERMYHDCETKSTIQSKIILEQKEHITSYKEELVSTNKKLTRCEGALNWASIIILALLIKIAFFSK